MSLVRLNTEEILHFLLDIIQIFAAGNILCVKAVAEQHDVDSTIIALGSLLQGNPFVLAIFITILRNATFVGVVFVLQSEHHLSISSISILSHSLDGQSNFCLLVAVGRRNLTPVWLACYFPFALGVNHQFLLMLRAQGAGYRWTANELVVSCDSLEVAPAWCSLILGNGRLRNFESEVILGYAIANVIENIGMNVALAYDTNDFVTFLKSVSMHGINIQTTCEPNKPMHIYVAKE